MFGIGGGEILVIALVALIAVGPEQLPGVMRRIGQLVGQARSMADSARAEFMSASDELDPTKWTGDGTDEKPIVPRGFASGPDASEKPVTQARTDAELDDVAPATDQAASTDPDSDAELEADTES